LCGEFDEGVGNSFGHVLKSDGQCFQWVMADSVASARLLAIALDTTERDSGGVQWAVEGALLLGAARATRLLWLFDAVIRATDRDLADSPQPATQGSSATHG
jgi:hypothetical protein